MTVYTKYIKTYRYGETLYNESISYRTLFKYSLLKPLGLVVTFTITISFLVFTTSQIYKILPKYKGYSNRDLLMKSSEDLGQNILLLGSGFNQNILFSTIAMIFSLYIATAVIPPSEMSVRAEVNYKYIVDFTYWFEILLAFYLYFAFLYYSVLKGDGSQNYILFYSWILLALSNFHQVSFRSTSVRLNSKRSQLITYKSIVLSPGDDKDKLNLSEEQLHAFRVVTNHYSKLSAYTFLGIKWTRVLSYCYFEIVIILILSLLLQGITPAFHLRFDEFPKIGLTNWLLAFMVYKLILTIFPIIFTWTIIRLKADDPNHIPTNIACLTLRAISIFVCSLFSSMSLTFLNLENPDIYINSSFFWPNIILTTTFTFILHFQLEKKILHSILSKNSIALCWSRYYIMKNKLIEQVSVYQLETQRKA